MIMCRNHTETWIEEKFVPSYERRKNVKISSGDRRFYPTDRWFVSTRNSVLDRDLTGTHSERMQVEVNKYSNHEDFQGEGWISYAPYVAKPVEDVEVEDIGEEAPKLRRDIVGDRQ